MISLISVRTRQIGLCRIQLSSIYFRFPELKSFQAFYNAFPSFSFQEWNSLPFFFNFRQISVKLVLFTHPVYCCLHIPQSKIARCSCSRIFSFLFLICKSTGQSDHQNIRYGEVDSSVHSGREWMGGRAAGLHVHWWDVHLLRWQKMYYSLETPLEFVPSC